jgi:NADH dehydrogenase FAD-containing subunit
VRADGIDGARGRCRRLVVWATGAAPLPFPCGPGLPLDADGFVRVEPTLEVVGCRDLFAVGDCASLSFAPWVRKAGVYAVREGPALDANPARTALRRARDALITRSATSSRC